MPKKPNDILVSYCQWAHVEKRDRRVIDGEKHNLNACNLTDCADIMISDDAADGLIDTAIDVDNLTDCADDAAGGLIAAINDGDLTDCADLLISDDAAGGLIATAIDAVKVKSCADDSAGGLVSAIDAGYLTDCADILISDDAADELITEDFGDSMN